MITHGSPNDSDLTDLIVVQAEVVGAVVVEGGTVLRVAVMEL